MPSSEFTITAAVSSSIPVLGSRFVQSLPADTVSENYSRQVADALYSTVLPTPVSAPAVLLYSPSICAALGFSDAVCQSPEFAQLMVGNQLFPGVQPFATRYGGHQFGHWAGQLGDGRAINLGELKTRDGSFLSLQLKGAGPTPYSRGADGRAVLRSSVREFLCSEAMHFLGVPTTRALSLVLTGDEVNRDMFYDGHPQDEPGAIVCRVAPSFTRFGSFQLCAYRGETELLRRAILQCIRDDFPHLPSPEAMQNEEQLQQLMLQWFEQIAHSTAQMIVHWMRVGFVHGVMNTDNMSVLGLTIDYGPYGWLDHYDPQWTPNTTDAQTRRYRFSQQADIALWNLYQLANALLAVIQDAAAVESLLKAWPAYYEDAWFAMMGQKIGLSQVDSTEDRELIRELLRLLEQRETDMTIFFRSLADFEPEGGVGALSALVQQAYYDENVLPPEQAQAFTVWGETYARRLLRDSRSKEERKTQMNVVNPCFVLRNYLAQEAIDLAYAGDYTRLHALHEALQKPYEEQEKFTSFYQKRPEWARHRAGASMLSCSS